MLFQLIPAAALWRRLYRDTKRAAQQIPAVPPRLRLSENAVVGVSLNVPMVGNCQGKTAICARTCYAGKGTLAFTGAISVQVANQRRLDHLATAPIQELRVEADLLAHGVQAQGLDVLRINGSGDLSPGSVRLINVLSRRHPELRLWIASRRTDLARKIHLRPNVYLMLSADQSTPPAKLAQMLRLRRKDPRRVRLAWLRVGDEPVPPEVAVVFREHRGSFRSSLPLDARDCPKTVPLAEGGIAHENACLRCRACFSDAPRGARRDDDLRRSTA